MHARVAFLTFCVLFGSVSTSRAQDPRTEDEAHVKRGIELRTEGKNREALDEFQKAYAIQKAPRTRAQIALAYQAIGEWIEAERGLEDALSATGDPWISRYRAALEGSLAVVQAHLGWLDVAANVDGAELLLNGVHRGTLPLREAPRVVAGTVVIEVRAPGYVPSRRSIDVAAASRAREVLSLEREIASPIAASPKASVDAAPTTSASGPEVRSEAGFPRKLVGIAALGGAAIFGAAGIVAWRVHAWNVDTYDDESRCIVGNLTRDQSCGGNGAMATTALVLEISAFALAGVAAGIGTWLVATPSAHRTSNASVGCGPIAGMGIVCKGVF